MKPTPSTVIATAWTDYVAAVGLTQAPADQLRECRRAFYGGAVSMLTACIGIAQTVSDDAPGLDDGAALLEGLSQECAAFAQAVKAGTA